MNRVLDRRSQLAALLIALIAVLGMPTAVLAENEAFQGSSVAKGETVENDVFLMGTDVTLDGEVGGDVVIFGRTIVVNGDVAGSMVIIGENVIMNGQVEGSVYAATVTFSHLSEAVIGRSLYYLGVSLQTEKDSTISRDLTAVTLGVQQAGNVGRNPNIIAGIGEIARLILDRINARTTGFTISEATDELEGSSMVPAIAGLGRLAASIGPAPSARHLLLAQEETDQSVTVVDWLVDRLRELVTLLLVGGLLTWLFPRQLAVWGAQLRQAPLASGAWGLVAYVVGSVAPILFLLLVLVVGISLAAVTLWSLAWIWWVMGLGVLLLYLSLFAAAVVFVSKIIVAFVFGQLLFERFTAQPHMRRPWPLLIGLIIYVLIAGIPYLGWGFALVVTLLGLGAIWVAFSSRDERRKSAIAD